MYILCGSVNSNISPKSKFPLQVKFVEQLPGRKLPCRNFHHFSGLLVVKKPNGSKAQKPGFRKGPTPNREHFPLPIPGTCNSNGAFSVGKK